MKAQLIAKAGTNLRNVWIGRNDEGLTALSIYKNTKENAVNLTDSEIKELLEETKVGQYIVQFS